MTDKKYTAIPRRLRSVNKEDPYVTGAEDIDAGDGKTQEQVNIETNQKVSTLEEAIGTGGSVDERIAVETQRAQDAEGFLQNQINGLNSQNYVTIAATNTWTLANINSLISTAAGTDAEKVDTVYRVGNWDGSQFDETVYSEYAWNGSQYVHLSTKTQIGEVFDISAYYATGGTITKYANLAEALGTNGANIPQSLQKGGMSVKFVQTSDNKYIQARLMAQNFTTDVTQWQGVDDEPTAGSNNLVKSGGVYSSTPTVANSSVESDLDIADEQGNVLMRLANGHLQVKNFTSEDVLDSIQAILSNIGFDNIPEFNEEEDYAIGEIVRYGKLVYVFTSAHEAGEWDASDVEETVITTEHPVEVVNGSSGSDLDISDEQGNTLAEFKNGGIKTKNFDSSKVPQNSFLPYQRRTYFVQSVNTFNYLTTDFVAESINSYDTPVYYNDNVVLYLPESYSVDGKPTKLIIYCKHGQSTIEPSSDDILTGSMGRIFRYMLHLGYGILAADGVPNDWATAKKLGERAVGNYVAVESTIRAFEYVKEKYNIDHDNVYIFGYSQGGHYAQNVIDNSNIPIAAAAELSPVCSMRYHQWDLSASGIVDGVSYTKLARLNIARIFDFPAVANNTELLALEYDPTKTVGYDPWNRNVENMFTGFEKNSSDLWVLPNSTSLDDITMKKHIRCPLKIWAADNDNALGVDVMKVFIKAVKNSGQVADLQLYTSGGHNIPTVQSSIGTFTENGDTCNLYPIAIDIASWFFNFGGYSLI